MKFSNRRKRQNVDISMLNLIDVIFMLLIFFMLATTFNNYSQFQLSVPKTSAQLEIEVIVNKDKKYFLKIDDKTRELSQNEIASEFSKLPKEALKNITLTADEHLEYKDIVDTMSILKNMNIENISLNIQNKN